MELVQHRNNSATSAQLAHLHLDLCVLRASVRLTSFLSVAVHDMDNTCGQEWQSAQADGQAG
jgi:hypothetical protein